MLPFKKIKILNNYNDKKKGWFVITLNYLKYNVYSCFLK